MRAILSAYATSRENYFHVIFDRCFGKKALFHNLADSNSLAYALTTNLQIQGEFHGVEKV